MDMSPLHNEVRAIVADTLTLTNDANIDTVRLGEHPNWDSMRHMEMLMALEARFGVRFPSYVIPQLADVDSIAAAVAEYQGRKTAG